MDRFFNYLKDTSAELKQVNWPTQQQAFIYTALVIGISAVTAVFLGVFDYIFTQFIDVVVNAI